jgi:ABC-type glycerol-3-phosphate transport system substrate-binding protein
MRKLSVLFIVLALVVVALPTMAQEEDLSGTTVTIFGAYTEPAETDSFVAGFEAFEEETGIDVVYQGASDFEVLIATRIEGGDPRYRRLPAARPDEALRRRGSGPARRV